MLPRVVVLGAGPAGLTAAYDLTKRGVTPTVVEADTVVGGISRTVERDGWRFDIGGHRFFTKVPEVEALWHEILPQKDFLLRPRMSRILYGGKLFDYPLRAGNALRSLGALESLRCLLSYAWVRVRPPRDQSTFEGWTAARFGWRLYRMFFKTYTEKVWGVPADEIQADWAAQRIKNLSLLAAIRHSLGVGRGTQITSLIEEFEYPRLGPGMMWERARDLVEQGGGRVVLDAEVVQVRRGEGRATHVVVAQHGVRRELAADQVISSIPLGHLVERMDPPAPATVLAAAAALRYRDFLTVALVVPEDAGFPDNWIYVHSPDVRLGRIQNFAAWSPDLVKPGWTCLGLEYFVNEGDDLWTMADDELIALGTGELARLGLVSADAVRAGYVVRMPKAYPMYDDEYAGHVRTMREWLEAETPNVHPVGRNGMHRYNNQDHSMYTALLAVDNIFGAAHDVWDVNVEADYHEERRSDPTLLRAPRISGLASLPAYPAAPSEPVVVDLTEQEASA